jgi:four helix bundle protein
MVRTADAIGANIAEATGRWSRKDQVRCLYVARGEAHELQHWLARGRASELPCPQNALTEANRVGRMLNGLIGALLNGRISSL